MSFRKLILASIAVWAVIVLGTYVAGEQTEVVRAPARATRPASRMDRPRCGSSISATSPGCASPIRSAPGTGGCSRIRSVELERGGRSEPRLAIPDESPATRASVDEAFAAKYGLVDRWYGLLVRHDAVPIRLVPREPEP